MFGIVKLKAFTHKRCLGQFLSKFLQKLDFSILAQRIHKKDVNSCLEIREYVTPLEIRKIRIAQLRLLKLYSYKHARDYFVG